MPWCEAALTPRRVLALDFGLCNRVYYVAKRWQCCSAGFQMSFVLASPRCRMATAFPCRIFLFTLVLKFVVSHRVRLHWREGITLMSTSKVPPQKLIKCRTNEYSKFAFVGWGIEPQCIKFMLNPPFRQYTKWFLISLNAISLVFIMNLLQFI